MLLFAFLRGGFSIHCHSANEGGVPVPSKPFMAQGQNNRRLARWKAHFDLCRVDLMFRMSRASCSRAFLFIVLRSAQHPQIPRFLQIFRGIWPMPLSLLNHPALALFAQRTRIPTSARSIGFCAIWVCISSSSSSSCLWDPRQLSRRLCTQQRHIHLPGASKWTKCHYFAPLAHFLKYCDY